MLEHPLHSPGYSTTFMPKSLRKLWEVAMYYPGLNGKRDEASSVKRYVLKLDHFSMVSICTSKEGTC